MIDETKLIKFLASEIKAVEDGEKNQIQTGEIMEMSVANIKRNVYQYMLDKIINDEFASKKY